MADDVFESLDGFEIQMDTYALYLYYRVQHSLYEILKDQMPKLTWQDAIYIFRSVKEILDSSRYVLIMTIADFCQKGSYDFYRSVQSRRRTAGMSWNTMLSCPDLRRYQSIPADMESLCTVIQMP